ncbi:MAG: anti-sigma factor antagonist [Acidimicrobiales bacterium]
MLPAGRLSVPSTARASGRPALLLGKRPDGRPHRCHETTAACAVTWVGRSTCAYAPGFRPHGAVVSCVEHGGIPIDLSVCFLPPTVVVRVRGEVDLLTAPSLGALVWNLIDRGHTDVVVDLLGVEFMDASGLGVIASATALLQSAGGTLSIRSPSVTVRRLLEVVDMAELIAIGPLDPAAGVLGSEQRSGDHSGSVTSSRSATSVPAGWIAADFARVAALPAASDVVDASLRLVTALARATVGGADGVSVSLKRHGQVATVAASDETIAQMDRDQYATGEGPCLSAASEGHWFHIESLAEESRWPQFCARAVEDGIGSILSTPLMVSDRPVGALNIYSNTERAFGPQDQELAALFATQASGILAEVGVDVVAEEVAKRLQGALELRETIAQAQGVLMARQGVTAEAAYAALRQSAKRTGKPVRDRAAEIVASTPREGLIGEVTA